MQQGPILLVTIAIALVSAIHAQQVNPSLCPDGPTSPTLDPSWRPVPSRFELMTELVVMNEVAELSQAFSTQRDAVAFTARGQLQFYWNFETNEQFEVLPLVIENQVRLTCLRQAITPESQTSTVEPNTLFVKPSVLLGYDPRNQVNPLWGVLKTGNSTLRGIPTNVFKSCFYVNDIRATVAAIYQVSDATKFQTYLPGNESIILEINVQVLADSGQTESFTYNVFHYTPNPSRQEQRLALETPSGVFCPNRISTLAVPSNLPERISFNNEFLVPELNRSILSTNQLFDRSVNFTRSDFWAPNPNSSRPGMNHYTEIHDFGTGLSYKYDHQTWQCTVDDIRPGSGDTVTVPGQPNLVQMSGGLHLFLMDDIIYQYTGEKRCRDRVWCNVWIGEKPMPNNTGVEHREWHWASEFNGDPLQQWIPVKLIINRLDSQGKSLSSFEFNLFNFRRNSSSIFEIDYTIADCYRAMGPEENFNLGVISFTVANDEGYPVQKNIDYLRYKIWEKLTDVLKVRPIRLSNIIVDHDGKDLPVTFTLLDAPPRLGPVEFPLQEDSLTTLITLLRTVIDSNALVFQAQSDLGEVTLKARIDSLRVIYTSFDQKPDQCLNQTSNRKQNPDQCANTTIDQNLNQNIEITYKSSGPLITGFWIGFIVLGLLIGIVGGFFVLRRFSKR